MTAFEPPRPQDKFVILRRVPVFASCTEDQLHLIADRTRLVEYKKGELVYREGDQADAFYIISSGRVRVLTRTAQGEEKTLTVLHNGDSFGEISLLIGETHSATVQTLNDALILQLQKKDFEEVINRIPSLVLYLSRSLSRRLRTSNRGGEFSDATIVAVYSAVKQVGRTSFAAALATSLRHETGRSVIVVDVSAPDGRAGQLLPVTAEGEPVEGAIVPHPLGYSLLPAEALITQPGGEQAIAPLLSSLTNRFHYVLLDLPVELNSQVLKALTQSDLVYLLTDPQKEHIIRTNALILQLRASIGPVEQRIKVVLNQLVRTGEGQLSPSDAGALMEQPIAVVLPHADELERAQLPDRLRQMMEQPATAYARTVRRIARELGGQLIGLALGSGAALGLAHIGILKVIEREKIPIDLIAGSSIGALIAGLWASGHSADDLERMALSFKNPWDIRKLFLLDLGIPLFSVLIGLAAGVLVGWLAEFWIGLLFGFIVCVAVGVVLGPLTGGPIQGARLMAKLEQDFAGKTFDDTWLPLKIVAANPIAREEVIFDSGSLADAVRASVSIPGIFKPVTRKGKLCLDGGIVNPIPVSVLKRSGAHHVIAVNVFPTTAELTAHRQDVQRRRAERDAQLASRSLPFRLLFRVRQELIRSVSPLVFDVIMRSMQAMEYQIAEIGCREADLTLRPTVPGSHWLEFFNPEPFIRRGEEVALQYLPELKRIARVRSVDNFPQAQ